LIICGCDEAGRGSAVAEVYAAAVVLDPQRPIEGVADSKKLTPARRDILFDEIKKNALAWSIATADLHEIERLNILGATLLAMKRAVDGLSLRPDKVLVDGNRAPNLDMEVETVIKGDDKIAEISAASILAKVARDRAMMEYHKLYPQYGIDVHKGYLTKAHMEALHRYGPSIIHRSTYSPIRELLSARQIELF
jgi:ribonuclease HII